jgi:3-methyladenine DNA glycosylase/8-oxoguanine DNA glycosylase
VTSGGRSAATALEVEVRPPWPYRLPGRGGGDGVMRVRRGVASRLLHVEEDPIVVYAWQRRDGHVVLRACPAPRDGDAARARRDGSIRARLELAVARMRFALGVDDDYRELYATFRGDPLLGRAIRSRRTHRPRRRPWAWEALAWSVTMQLIEVSRAAEIQRRMVWRWGRSTAMERGTLRDVPTAALIASRAPAELAAMDLAPARSLALIRAAREVARGRVDPAEDAGDTRLLAIPEIGPWTVQCLGLYGRGEPDALPAGDLGFVKLVGRLADLGRRATVAEVEEFFAPYAPFRGLAGSFVLAAFHRVIAAGPPLRIAA